MGAAKRGGKHVTENIDEMAKPTPEPVRIAVKSLADVGRVTKTVEITDVDGTVLVFTLRFPSARRWADILRSVNFPKPPPSGFDKLHRPIFDEHDATYLKARAAAYELANFRLLGEALHEDMALPGADYVAWGEALYDGLNAEVSGKLIEQLSGQQDRMEADTQARAATFHSERLAAPASAKAAEAGKS